MTIFIPTHHFSHNPPLIAETLASGVTRQIVANKHPLLGSSVLSDNSAALASGASLSATISVAGGTNVALFVVVNQGANYVRGKYTLIYRASGVDSTLDFLPLSNITTLCLFNDGASITRVFFTNNSNVTVSATLYTAENSSLISLPSDGIHNNFTA